MPLLKGGKACAPAKSEGRHLLHAPEIGSAQEIYVDDCPSPSHSYSSYLPPFLFSLHGVQGQYLRENGLSKRGQDFPSSSFIPTTADNHPMELVEIMYLYWQSSISLKSNSVCLVTVSGCTKM